MKVLTNGTAWAELLAATMSYVMAEVTELDLATPERVNPDYLVFEALVLGQGAGRESDPGSRLESIISAALQPLLHEPEIQAAIDILRRTFTEPESIGPRHVVMEVTGAPNREIQHELVGWVHRLLNVIDRLMPHEAEA